MSDQSDASTAAVKAVAEGTAKQIISELDLSAYGGRLNYKMFIGWWQRQLKVHHSSARISDEELQVRALILSKM